MLRLYVTPQPFSTSGSRARVRPKMQHPIIDAKSVPNNVGRLTREYFPLKVSRSFLEMIPIKPTGAYVGPISVAETHIRRARRAI